MTIPTACVSVGRTAGIPNTIRDYIPSSMTAKKENFKAYKPCQFRMVGGDKVLFKSATQATPIFSKIMYFINNTLPV